MSFIRILNSLYLCLKFSTLCIPLVLCLYKIVFRSQFKKFPNFFGFEWFVALCMVHRWIRPKLKYPKNLFYLFFRSDVFHYYRPCIIPISFVCLFLFFLFINCSFRWKSTTFNTTNEKKKTAQMWGVPNNPQNKIQYQVGIREIVAKKCIRWYGCEVWLENS